MAPLPLSYSRFSDDQATWDSLKRAISLSSGFQRWQLEKADDVQQLNLSHDQLVLRYLRETLETLAY
jgi:hypothetical protein